MDMMALFIPQGNDVIVTARFPDISDGTGMNSELWYKPDKTTPDADPSVMTYTSPVIPDPDFAGQTMSQYPVPAADNGVTGAHWWRVDVIDSLNHRRTAACGTYMVEAV